MYVKIVDANKNESGYFCTHYVKRQQPDGSLRVELCGGGDEVPPYVVLLPHDSPSRHPADPIAVFIVSDANKGSASVTVEKIWAPRGNTSNGTSGTNEGDSK